MKSFKEIRKGYHRMPDGSIMKDSDHPKGAKKENMSLAPKGKGREAAKKLYKASYEEIEDTEEAVSPAQRRARKHASLLKTMAALTYSFISVQLSLTVTRLFQKVSA